MKQVPLINPQIERLRLPDGRDLTWQTFGVPQGRPVLYFHGGGSFSLEAGLFHREAVERGIRLIATNRPGTGGSSLCPGRPVARYADDVGALLDHLTIDRIACLGESNGGMVTMAIAATMHDRVLGAVPINPTLPWHDPLARRSATMGVALAYRLMRYAPGLIAAAASGSVRRIRRKKSAGDTFDALDLFGPPPGTEPDIAQLQWQVMEKENKAALLPELKWAAADWGFDPYSIPVPLDFFCGFHDVQGPFALILADRNPDARFHSFSYGHHGFSHPDARARIFDMVASYFTAPDRTRTPGTSKETLRAI